MSTTKLLWLEHEGLKARDARFDLDDVNLWLGSNGSGKSTVLEALRLLVEGKVAGVDANAAGIMSLARPSAKAITVRCGVKVESGRVVTIERTWKRKRGGGATQDIKTNLTPAPRNLDDSKSKIFDLLGGLREAWDPGEMLRPTREGGLSAAELRQRLLRSLPKTELSLESVVPDGLPDWAKPTDVHTTADEWIDYALRKAGEELNAAHAEKRKAEEAVGELWWTEPEDPAPLQEKLSILRAELLNRRQRDLAEERLAKALREMETLRAVVGTDAPQENDAIAAHGVVQASLAAVREIVKQQRAELTQAQGEMQRLKLELSKLPRPALDGATADEVEAAKAERMETAQMHERLAADVKRIEAEIAALGQGPSEKACPHCGGDLESIWTARRGRLLAERTTKLEEQGIVAEALREAEAYERERIAALRRVELERQTAEATARITTMLETLASPTEELAQLELEETRARDLVEKAKAAAKALAAYGHAERRAADLAKECDALPVVARAGAEIEAEIRDVEGRLTKIGEAVQRKKQRDNAKETIALAEKRAEDISAWQSELRAIEESILAKSAAWAERLLSEVMGASVRVRLADESGKVDCSFVVDGVPAETRSKGEQWRFLAALVVVLGAASDAPWRPLVLDEIERVSLEYRADFIRAVQSAVTRGFVSQILLAGCPDISPDVAGVKVFRLDVRSSPPIAVGAE